MAARGFDAVFELEGAGEAAVGEEHLEEYSVAVRRGGHTPLMKLLRMERNRLIHAPALRHHLQHRREQVAVHHSITKPASRRFFRRSQVGVALWGVLPQDGD